MKRFIEDAQLSGSRITTDGYLVASVLCARTGIQDYLGEELDKPDMPIVKVYRPESSVFAKDHSLRLLASRRRTTTRQCK